MDKYVVSKELAEKLKATGYPQNISEYVYMPGAKGIAGYKLVESVDGWYAAPMTDELLDQLTEVKTGLTLYHVHSTMQWEAFYAGKFFEYGTSGQHWDFQADKPADALAKLWLWIHGGNDLGLEHPA